MGWMRSVVFGSTSPRPLYDGAPRARRHDPLDAFVLPADSRLRDLSPAHATDRCDGRIPHKRDELVIAAAADGSFASLGDSRRIPGSDGVVLSSNADSRVRAILRWFRPASPSPSNFTT